MDDFSVTDARGTGAGWHVTIQATQFATTGPHPKTLPLDSLFMLPPHVATIDGTSGDPPNIAPGPYAIDTGSAVQIASAARGEGMGSYVFTPGGALTLKVGSDAYPGTYSSTITVLVVSGP